MLTAAGRAELASLQDLDDAKVELQVCLSRPHRISADFNEGATALGLSRSSAHFKLALPPPSPLLADLRCPYLQAPSLVQLVQARLLPSPTLSRVPTPTSCQLARCASSVPSQAAPLSSRKDRRRSPLSRASGLAQVCQARGSRRSVCMCLPWHSCRESRRRCCHSGRTPQRSSGCANCCSLLARAWGQCSGSVVARSNLDQGVARGC